MHALITGAAGQDGVILSHLLLREGYRVTGLIRPGQSRSLLCAYAPQVEVVECDLGDSTSLKAIVLTHRPTEIYNLGGVTSIMDSIKRPEVTWLVNVAAVATLLEAVAEISKSSPCRFVEAASGTIYEGSDVAPQDESTAPEPRTPYAVTKCKAMDLISRARHERGLHASSAILYNHESPLRGPGFVTRRITQAATRIAAGLQDHVQLGNVDVFRDWGWAPDYVGAMRLMMAAEVPGDYVLATGQTHRLTDFLDVAFRSAGLANWRDYVRTRHDLQRPVDSSTLCGDSSKAYRELGWTHTKTFPDIVVAMVDHDMRLIRDPNALWQPRP